MFVVGTQSKQKFVQISSLPIYLFWGSDRAFIFIYVSAKIDLEGNNIRAFDQERFFSQFCSDY